MQANNLVVVKMVKTSVPGSSVQVKTSRGVTKTLNKLKLILLKSKVVCKNVTPAQFSEAHLNWAGSVPGTDTFGSTSGKLLKPILDSQHVSN